MSIFTSTFWQIPSLTHVDDTTYQTHIDIKTKPVGSLGKLESLALLLARIQLSEKHLTAIEINQPHMLVFAADHGIAKHSVSIAPQAVTQQMVTNFIAGGAAINCFCNANDVGLSVIDCGMLAPIDSSSDVLINQSIGPGTQDFSTQPAMSQVQLEQAIQAGANIAKKQIATGSNVLGFGEMGIGNTSSASALLVALTGLSVEQTVGLGTGITDEQLTNKKALIEQGIQRARKTHQQQKLSPEIALMEFGGFEIAQMVGAMLATAASRRVMVVDGFIVSIAALLAVDIAPEARAFMVFAHQSEEHAHHLIMTELHAEPLLDLHMRLGEGTGAALAMPLLRSAAYFYNHMATFASANVTV